MSRYRIALTRHAATMLSERGIEREWVERTVIAPDHLENDPRHADTLWSFRAIPERGGRFLRVVHKLEGNEIKIITAFFDRAKRR